MHRWHLHTWPAAAGLNPNPRNPGHVPDRCVGPVLWLGRVLVLRPSHCNSLLTLRSLRRRYCSACPLLHVVCLPYPCGARVKRILPVLTGSTTRGPHQHLAASTQGLRCSVLACLTQALGCTAVGTCIKTAGDSPATVLVVLAE
jgi:hypothetical protein